MFDIVWQVSDYIVLYRWVCHIQKIPLKVVNFRRPLPWGLPMPAVDACLSQAWEKLGSSGAEVSPFFESLLELLGVHVHGAPLHQFRCIVFVETRSAATTMTQMLKFVAGSERTFAWISPVCLLGHCKTNAESMTMAQQNEILRNFREGNWVGLLYIVCGVQLLDSLETWLWWLC